MLSYAICLQTRLYIAFINVLAKILVKPIHGLGDDWVFGFRKKQLRVLGEAFSGLKVWINEHANGFRQ